MKVLFAHTLKISKLNFLWITFNFKLREKLAKYLQINSQKQKRHFKPALLVMEKTPISLPSLCSS
jgi:hypothetical protein